MTQAQARKKLLRGFQNEQQAAKYWADVLTKHPRTIRHYINKTLPINGRVLVAIERHDPVWFRVANGDLFMAKEKTPHGFEVVWHVFEARDKASENGTTTDAHASRLIPTAIDGWLAACHGVSRDKYPKPKTKKVHPRVAAWFGDVKQTWLAAYDFRKSLQ